MDWKKYIYVIGMNFVFDAIRYCNKPRHAGFVRTLRLTATSRGQDKGQQPKSTQYIAKVLNQVCLCNDDQIGAYKL
jgi:hypothetical protein